MSEEVVFYLRVAFWGLFFLLALCYVIFPEDPAVSPGDEGVLYGMAAGTYSVISEGGVKMYPRIEGYFIEKK